MRSLWPSFYLSKNLPDESSSTNPPEFSFYDQFIAIHTASVSVTAKINNGHSHNLGHGNAGFLPWHREFLLRLQKGLTSVDSSVILPYWDWTAHRATMDYLFTDKFLGQAPATTPRDAQQVTSGYFTPNLPATLPAWWPAGLLQGWQVPTALRLSWQTWGGKLHRRVGPEAHLPSEETIQVLMGMSTYRRFWAGLERGVGLASLDPEQSAFGPTHNWMHDWVGGHMSEPFISPFDPVFSLNHAYVDYLWDRWQRDDHVGAAFYPSTQNWDGAGMPGEIPRGHLLRDALYPWVGSDASDYIADFKQTHHFLPNVSKEKPRHPVDLLETDNLSLDPNFNYLYQDPLPRFSKVKKILDDIIADWMADRGRSPNLFSVHHNAQFGWADRDQLRDGVARGRPLIAPEMIGNNRAEETNLVRILRSRLNQFPRMPHNGPYVTDTNIDFVASWIDHGCLDDVEPPQ